METDDPDTTATVPEPPLVVQPVPPPPLPRVACRGLVVCAQSAAEFREQVQEHVSDHGVELPSSSVPRQTAMARIVPTMCCDRMRMGGPSPAPSAAVRLQSHGYSLTMVHWCGHSARSLVGAKRLQRSPRQRGSGSWRRKSRICSSSWPSQLQQQDKAKLIPLWSTTLRWTPRRVRSTPCARRSKISRPTWRGPTLWIRGHRPSSLAASRGTLRLCSSNSTQQLSSWKGARPLRSAWQPPSSVRLSASKQNKPQLTWLRVPNSLWSWPPRRHRRQSKHYELPRMSWPRPLQRLVRWQRSEPMGQFRPHHWQTFPMKPLPVSFERTMPRGYGWREQNIQSLIAEAVVTALARQQGQSNATPSEAVTDDAPNLSELESIDQFTDDDSSWAKLDKGKRKALVNRERAEMAGKLMTTILKRVVQTELPFKVARKQSHDMRAQQPAHGHPIGPLAWNQDWRGSGSWAL